MTIDPIYLATVTAAVTVMAKEVAKGGLSAAGKASWDQISSLLGWKHPPADEHVAPTIASTLAARPDIAGQIVALLQQTPAIDSSRLVGSIQGGKVVAANTITVHGDFVMGD